MLLIMALMLLPSCSFQHPCVAFCKLCKERTFLFDNSRKRSIWPLFNFLDDFKSGQEEKVSDDPSFPPAICPSEIHRVRFCTTAGDFVIELDLSLSPSGVTRFLELVDDAFFTDQLLYRVDPGFVVQFGIASQPLMQAKWDPKIGAPVAPLPDEPNRAAFKAGSVSFAGSGVDSRSCHLFIALEPGARALGKASHETVLGNVEDEGMLVLEQLVKNREEKDYGNLIDLQSSLAVQGNEAAAEFPGIDRIIACGRI